MAFAFIHMVWQIFPFRYCGLGQVRRIAKEYEPYSSRCRRIFDLKVVLFSMTDVPPERQKILGLVKGKLPPDDERM